MKTLHSCQACGFLSTLGSEFVRISDSALLCIECKKDADAGKELKEGEE